MTRHMRESEGCNRQSLSLLTQTAPFTQGSLKDKNCLDMPTELLRISPTREPAPSKPPLCKGRWHGGAVTEGLYDKLPSPQRNPPNENKVFIGWYFIEVQTPRKSHAALFQSPLRSHR